MAVPVTLALTAAGGCDLQRRPTGGVETASWPFGPRSLRVHPLTRVVVRVPEGSAFRPAAAPSLGIEAHIELRDFDGVVTRGIGLLRLQLVAQGEESLEPQHWSVDLFDLECNRAFYDSITQTYRVPLELAWTTTPRSRAALLTARLELPGGRVLDDRRTIDWPNFSLGGEGGLSATRTE